MNISTTKASTRAKVRKLLEYLNSCSNLNLRAPLVFVCVHCAWCEQYKYYSKQVAHEGASASMTIGQSACEKRKE